MATHRRRIVLGLLSSVLGTGVSRVLGAARDIAISHRFGAGMVSDAFWVAFTVPSVFRRFVADEGLTGALLPAVAREEGENGLDAAKALSDVAFTGLLLASGTLSLAGILGAPLLVKMFGWGFSEHPEQFALAVRLTRWMFPFVIMVSLVSFCEALLNHRGHFFVPKVAPGVVSAALVAATLWGTGFFEEPAMALPAGLLVGGLLHLLIQVPPMARLWRWPRISLAFGNPRFRLLLREMGKVVVIGITAQVNIMVLRSLATLLMPGSVSHYWYANRLVDLTQGMIAVGLGSALLPAIAQDAAAGEWESFGADLRFALRLAGFMLIPVAAIMSAFALPLVSILFRHGSFSEADVRSTALTFICMVPFFLAMAGINLLKRAFFALDDRTTLIQVGIAGTLLTALVGYILSSPFGVAGLALALSISTSAQLALYLMLLPRRIGTPLRLGGLLRPLGRIALASLVPAGFVSLLIRLGDWSRGPSSLRNLLVVGGGLAGAFVVFLLAARALDLPEFAAVVRRLRSLSERRRRE
jgi:putative peptidoglycan lipid II flippase